MNFDHGSQGFASLTPIKLPSFLRAIHRHCGYPNNIIPHSHRHSCIPNPVIADLVRNPEGRQPGGRHSQPSHTVIPVLQTRHCGLDPQSRGATGWPSFLPSLTVITASQTCHCGLDPQSRGAATGRPSFPHSKPVIADLTRNPEGRQPGGRHSHTPNPSLRT